MILSPLKMEFFFGLIHIFYQEQLSSSPVYILIYFCPIILLDQSLEHIHMLMLINTKKIKNGSVFPRYGIQLN